MRLNSAVLAILKNLSLNKDPCALYGSQLNWFSLYWKKAVRLGLIVPEPKALSAEGQRVMDLVGPDLLPNTVFIDWSASVMTEANKRISKEFK